MSDEENELKSVLPKIYEDAISPAAKEVGKGLVVVAKTVNIALEPLNGLVWGYEQIREHLLSRLSEKLKDTPEEDIVTPQPHIAVPAIEALRYCSTNNVLRELFTSLLASSMKQQLQHLIHPAFVEVIKQLSPDEAIIINHLSGRSRESEIAKATIAIRTSIEEDIRSELEYQFSHQLRPCTIEYPENTNTYFDNLLRLGILYIQTDYKDDMADRLPKLSLDLDNFQEVFDMRRERTDTLKITEFGKQLIISCT